MSPVGTVCHSFTSAFQVCSGTDEDLDDRSTPFRQRPFCKYKGHTADLLDLSWSKVRASFPPAVYVLT